jgi:hypothetical protein
MSSMEYQRPQMANYRTDRSGYDYSTSSSVGDGTAWGAQIATRRAAPQPLGDVDFFPYSVALKNEELKITLDASPERIWTNGDEVRGSVTILQKDEKTLYLRKLEIRCFWEARTFYWSFDQVPAKTELEQRTQKYSTGLRQFESVSNFSRALKYCHRHGIDGTSRSWIISRDLSFTQT